MLSPLRPPRFITSSEVSDVMPGNTSLWSTREVVQSITWKQPLTLGFHLLNNWLQQEVVLPLLPLSSSWKPSVAIAGSSAWGWQSLWPAAAWKHQEVCKAFVLHRSEVTDYEQISDFISLNVVPISEGLCEQKHRMSKDSFLTSSHMEKCNKREQLSCVE